jgi:hypothetical protein
MAKQRKSHFQVLWRALLAIGLLGLSIFMVSRVLANISSNEPIFQLSASTPTYIPLDKAHYTPSQDEINADATGVAEQATAEAAIDAYTPPPPPTPVYYPVKSDADIPLVVLNDPFFKKDVNDPDFGPCVKAANPGKALYVKLLGRTVSGFPGYYVVPFYSTENEVCGVAMVFVKDSYGTLSGWSSAGGIPYPPISSENAAKMVEDRGYKVAGDPVLSFQWMREGVSDFFPFWAIDTADGQTFYVIYTRGVIEVWNAKDVHPDN